VYRSRLGTSLMAVTSAPKRPMASVATTVIAAAGHGQLQTRKGTNLMKPCADAQMTTENEIGS